MMNNSKTFYDTLHKSKIITPILLAAAIIFFTLFFYVPHITEKNSIEMATKNSITSVEQIKLTRAYYVDSVVKDVKKFAPNLKFSYAHEGINGLLPLPTTTIHNLSKIFSDNSGIKYNLYSNYPFAFKADRVLNSFQKEALKQIQRTDDGLYVKKDTIDGKPVLRVAVTDFMTDQACVDCHNTHPEKTWDFDWVLGDKRGVIEVITPLEDTIASNHEVRDNILYIISFVGLLLVIYLSFILLSREKELLDANDELSGRFKTLYKDFDKNVIASTTDKKGIIIYASEMFCRFSGYAREELIGKNHNIVRHADMPAAIFKEMWKTIESGKTWTGEVKNRVRDGGYYWVYAVITPVFDKNGNIIEYNAIRQDITSKKELEKLNENLEDRVAKAIIQAQEQELHMLNQSKLAQMGEMLSMIAHQWRQPLAAISSTASSMELKIMMDDYESAFFNSSIKNIQSYSQHLSRTINDFRNFFQDTKVLQQITFEKIIKDTLNIVQISLNNQNIIIEVQNNYTEEFSTYENEFKQVLLNLLKNSEDAILENKIVDAKIVITTYKKDNNIVLEVADNGGGIRDEIIDKIFDPYFSTKDKKNGTGLGLYMSKTIIEKHCAGSLLCSSTQNRAKFQIIL